MIGFLADGNSIIIDVEGGAPPAAFPHNFNADVESGLGQNAAPQSTQMQPMSPTANSHSNNNNSENHSSSSPEDSKYNCFFTADNENSC